MLSPSEDFIYSLVTSHISHNFALRTLKITALAEDIEKLKTDTDKFSGEMEAWVTLSEKAEKDIDEVKVLKNSITERTNQHLKDKAELEEMRARLKVAVAKEEELKAESKLGEILNQAAGDSEADRKEDSPSESKLGEILNQAADGEADDSDDLTEEERAKIKAAQRNRTHTVAHTTADPLVEDFKKQEEEEERAKIKAAQRDRTHTVAHTTADPLVEDFKKQEGEEKKGEENSIREE